MPVTATLAVSDLELYDYQLGTLFPPSADEYPTDSVRALKRARAAQWVERLLATHGMGVDGRQLIDFALVALRAGNDTLARRLIEARLRAVPASRPSRVQRSEALGSAIMTLTSPVQDSMSLGRNVPIARTYARELWEISETEYATRSDSTEILHHKLQATLALMDPALSLHASEDALLCVARSMAFIARLGFEERIEAVQRYPYRDVAMFLLQQSHGRARLDSLEGAMVQLVQSRADDPGPPGARVGRSAEIVQQLRDRFAWFALVGTAAPGIAAHAWINTVDSAYEPAPRTHSFTDGIVRVVVFSDNDSRVLVNLQRLHRRLASGTQVLLVTEIDGFVGPDLKSPPEEVAWLANYYHAKRHLTVPIAVWAGAKVPSDYGWPVPTPSPVRTAYHTNWMYGIAVLIDGAGIIREYMDLASRDDESYVAKRVQSLLMEHVRASIH